VADLASSCSLLNLGCAKSNQARPATLSTLLLSPRARRILAGPLPIEPVSADWKRDVVRFAQCEMCDTALFLIFTDRNPVKSSLACPLPHPEVPNV
jgi:hypothetical protein